MFSRCCLDSIRDNGSDLVAQRAWDGLMLSKLGIEAARHGILQAALIMRAKARERFWHLACGRPQNRAFAEVHVNGKSNCSIVFSAEPPPDHTLSQLSVSYRSQITRGKQE